MNTWPNETTLEFIDEIRLRRELWDVESESYKDRIVKKDSWTAIGEQFNISSDDAYRKYRSLRTYAKNEHKKKMKGKQVTWFAYDAISFVLSDVPDDKKDIVDATHLYEHWSDENDETMDFEERVDPLASAKSSQKKIKSATHVEAKCDKVIKHKQEEIVMLKSTYSNYGEHIANKLCRYDSYTRAQAEFQISKILYKADMGMLKHGSSLQGPNKDTASPENDYDEIYDNNK